MTKTAIITGATGGIGREFVKQISSYDNIAIYRSKSIESFQVTLSIVAFDI